MLRGPAGRSGEGAEDETAPERFGLGVRVSWPLFAVFLERAIWNGVEEMVLKVTRGRDDHGRKGEQKTTEMSQTQRDVSTRVKFLFWDNFLKQTVVYSSR
jgi:hypothetical protein